MKRKKQDMWEQEWDDLVRREERYIYKNCVRGPRVLEKLQRVVPDTLQSKLDAAFIKAFEIIFDKGTVIIEKTYNKEKRKSEYDVREYAAKIRGDKQNIRAFRKKAGGYARRNLLLSSVEGIGFGLVGLGIPDIPVFVSLMLRNLYEISLSFGYDYDNAEERYFQLRVIENALYSGEEMRKRDETMNTICKNMCGTKQRPPEEMNKLAFDLHEQIKRTAKALSDDMLYAKFLQGQMIVGVVGGATDVTVLKRITDYAMLKYRRRYLLDRDWQRDHSGETE